MKTFKSFIAEMYYILEGKLEDYIDSEKSISTDHDPHGEFKTPNDIIRHFHAHNPTGNIDHTRWMVNQYKKGNLKQEDAPSMKDALNSFNSKRDKLAKKNINQYKDLSELHNALHSVEGSKSSKETEQDKKDIEAGSTKVMDTPNVTLHHVHTTEASRALGKGLSWCTSRRDDQNMFNHYNAATGKRFYVANLHNEKHPYRRLGIGVGVNEFQDENNQRISSEDLKKLVDRNPDLKESKHLQGVRIETTKNIDDHIHDLIENDHDNLMQLHKDGKLSDKAKKIIDAYRSEKEKAADGDESVKGSRYSSVRRILARNTRNSALLSSMANDPHDAVRHEVAKNKNTGPDAHDKLVHDPSPQVRMSSLDYGDHSQKTIKDRLAKENNPTIFGMLLDDHDGKLSDDEKRKAADMFSREINSGGHYGEKYINKAKRLGYWNEEKHTKEIHDRISNDIDNGDSNARYNALNHHMLNKDHITKVITNPKSTVEDKYQALDNSNLVQPEHINHILNNPHEHFGIKEKALDFTPYVTKDHINHILTNPDEDYGVKIQALQSKHVEPKHINHILTNPDEDPEVKIHALRHHKDKVTPEHINHILTNPDEDPDVKKEALQSKHVEPKHINHILNNPDEDFDVQMAAKGIKIKNNW